MPEKIDLNISPYYDDYDETYNHANNADKK